MHLLTDLLEKRPDIDAGKYFQINKSTEQKLRHDTDAMRHEEFFSYRCYERSCLRSKCINADHG